MISPTGWSLYINNAKLVQTQLSSIPYQNPLLRVVFHPGPSARVFVFSKNKKGLLIMFHPLSVPQGHFRSTADYQIFTDWLDTTQTDTTTPQRPIRL